MLKILHKKPETLKDYTKEEKWTPYPLLTHLEQNTTVETGQNYLTNLNIYPDSVELVQKHLENITKQIAKLATHHALNKAHRATIMPEDITYALKKITGDPIK